MGAVPEEAPAAVPGQRLGRRLRERLARCPGCAASRSAARRAQSVWRRVSRRRWARPAEVGGPPTRLPSAAPGPPGREGARAHAPEPS